MIESLRIENLAVVERVEIEFGPGLNVLTGETGAGKSIVLGALGLLAGARASAEAIRDGAAEALVEAVFRIDGDPALEAALRERGLEAEEGRLVVARSVSREGRSRAWLAGRLVPVSALAELLGDRIEISSQHESQSLRRTESHGRLLDAFGGQLALRERVARGHAGLREATQERERLEAETEERARRQDFLQFQLDEIDAAGIEPGEFASLGAEHARLVHAVTLRAEAGAVAATLAGDASDVDGRGAVDVLEAVVRRLEPLGSVDPELVPLAERLRGAATELQELGRDLERYADAVEVDPGRLAEVEERIARIERLRVKYGRDEAAIAAFREQLAAELAGISGNDARLRALCEQEGALRAQLVADATALSRGRAAAAARLGREVEASLARLELADARLEVSLEPFEAESGVPCGATGAERVELRFSANAGEAPRALRRVASGGELSRVFLALKNALRGADAAGLLVFDEVDAGIGGRAADRVGSLLAELGAGHQVLCITHWPQIAAAAATQLLVRKRATGGRTGTEVERVEADARVEELARMAGGTRVGDATRAHARELLRGHSAGKPGPRRARRAPPPG